MAARRAGYPAWLAEIDKAHALRETDPVAALQAIKRLRTAWARLTGPERMVLEARGAAVAANAHFWRGNNEAANAEIVQLFSLAGDACLQGAAATLVRESWRARQSGHTLRGTLASRRGDDAAALRDFLAARTLARDLGDERSEARVLANLGNVYGHVGMEAWALAQYRQALPLAQRLGWRELVADIHHNIGAALGSCGEIEAALASHRLALSELVELGLTHKQVYPLGGICERLLQLGRIDEAIQALRDAQALIACHGEAAMRSYAAYLEVRIALERRDGPAARAAALAALALAREHRLRTYEGQALQDLARIDLEHGATDLARQHARQALALFEAANLREGTKESHEMLARIAEAGGDLAAALDHRKRFHDLHCALAEGRSAAQTKVLMIEYEVERARAEAEFQRLENARLTEALAQIGDRLQRGPELRPRAAGHAPATPQDLIAFGLTRREADVLFWVAQGKTNAEVVEILGTGLATVKKHLGRIFEKLGVENRTAASVAIRERSPR